MDSSVTAIISLYCINWLVFITETECVYCAVRTGFLYVRITHVSISAPRVKGIKFSELLLLTYLLTYLLHVAESSLRS